MGKDVVIKRHQKSLPWIPMYTYSASGEKLCAKYCIAAPNVTRTFGVKPEGYTSGQVISGYQYDYLMGGSLILWDGLIDKVLFDGGYANGTPVNNSTMDRRDRFLIPLSIKDNDFRYYNIK